MTTIRAACDSFLHNIQRNQPKTTYKSYKSDLVGVTGFIASLSPTVKPSHRVEVLTVDHGVIYLQSLLNRGLAVSTRQRAASALREFYRFASYTYNLNLSVDRLNYGIKSSKLLTGVKDVAEYPADKIQKILDFTSNYTARTLEDKRDKAFIFSLAETGLRVSEACAAKVGQVDKAAVLTLLGKGNKKRTVRFGKDSRRFLAAYLSERKAIDTLTGLSQGNLAIFARHDQRVGKNKIKHISPKTAEKIIHRFAWLALGDSDYDPLITCHKFRHYFITKVYDAKGIKHAQESADHSDIRTTARYIHNTKDKIETSKDIFG